MMACIHLSVLLLHFEAILNKYAKITFLIHTKRTEYPYDDTVVRSIVTDVYHMFLKFTEVSNFAT